MNFNEILINYYSLLFQCFLVNVCGLVENLSLDHILLKRVLIKNISSVMKDAGRFVSLCIYAISSSPLKNGSNVVLERFNVTFRYSTTF